VSWSSTINDGLERSMMCISHGCPSIFLDWLRKPNKKSQSSWCHLWQPSKVITSSQVSWPKFAFLCFHVCCMQTAYSSNTQSVKFQVHIFIVLFQSSVVLHYRRSATGPGNLEGMPFISKLPTSNRYCRLWGQWNTALSWWKMMHVSSPCFWLRSA